MPHDMFLVRVKKPSESEGPWDLLEVVSNIPSDQAYIATEDSACPLLGE